MPKSKIQRFTIDLPVDSVYAKWLNAQSDRKASQKLLIRFAIRRFGIKDVMEAAMDEVFDRVDLFHEDKASKDTITVRKSTNVIDSPTESDNTNDKIKESKPTRPKGLGRLS